MLFDENFIYFRLLVSNWVSVCVCVWISILGHVKFKSSNLGFFCPRLLFNQSGKRKKKINILKQKSSQNAMCCIQSRSMRITMFESFFNVFLWWKSHFDVTFCYLPSLSIAYNFHTLKWFSAQTDNIKEKVFHKFSGCFMCTNT